MFILKLPDFEGGFITKSIEGNEIVTRADDGTIIERKTINRLTKGLRTDFGRVIGFDDDDVVLLNEGKEAKANKEILNKYLTKSLKTQKHLQEFEREILTDGTFETPIGRVQASGACNELRELLVNPDKISAEGYVNKFYKSFNGKLLTADVGKKKLFSNLIVKSFSTKTIPLDKPKRPLLKSLNIFSTPKSQKTGGGESPLKGRERAGHKYIERKPNPNGEGYIYLYELPGGKKVWRDENKNEVKGTKTEEATDQQTATVNYTEKAKKYFEDFNAGDKIKRGESVGKILKISDNFLAVDFDGQKEVINKKNHLQNTEAHQNYKQDQTIDYDGKKVKLIQISKNLAMGKDDQGNFVLIKKEQPIEKYEAENKTANKENPRINSRKGINKYSYVTQGYGDLDNNPDNVDYEHDERYKKFDADTIESGMERIDDLTRRKYVDTGDEKHSVTWNYNPGTEKTDCYVDGIKDLPLEFMGEKYVVKDMNDKGYLLEHSKTGEDGIFLPLEDYKKYRDDETAKEKAGEVVTKNVDPYGGITIGEKGNKIIYKPEYTEEELARFNKRRGRLSITPKPKAAASQNMEDIQRGNEAIKQRNKEVMQGEAYGKFSKQIEARGFKAGENPFIATKKVEIDGRKFETRAEFNPSTQQYTTSVDGPVQNITVSGITYPITDVNQDKVFYQKGNSEKEISIEKLKELNGKGIFKPLSEGKAAFGRSRQIKLANGETHEGRYALVDLDDIIASHSESTFRNSEGYPIDDTSQNINDRDYEHDKNLQETVRKYARELDPHQLINNNVTAEGTPIVNNEMLVVSGNNRTMSSKLAANENPEKWKEYQEELANELSTYGIDPEEIKNYKKPFLVRVDDSINKLSKSELHKYNQDMKKGESEIASTIKFHDILKNHPGAVDKLIDVAKDFETQSELFSNKDAQDKLKKILLDTKIVTENKLSDYFTSDGLLTKSGQNISKQLFAASIFEPEVLRVSDVPGVKDVSNSISDNIAPLLVNKGIGSGFSLNKEINDAVNLQYKFSKSALKEQSGTFENFVTQRDMFTDSKPSYKSTALNYLAKKGSKTFSNVLKKYNEAAKLNVDAGMFGGFSPEDVFDKMVIGSIKTNNKGEESSMFSETEKKIISGLQKSLRNRFLRMVWKPLRKAIDKGKLILTTNKNPY